MRCDVCVCVQEPAWSSPPGAAFVAAMTDTWTATESHGHIRVLAQRSGICGEQVGQTHIRQTSTAAAAPQPQS